MSSLASETYRRPPAYPAMAVLGATPLICFAGALATDVTYWLTSEIQWANFSAWLLAIGMALGVLSLFVELVSIVRARRRRSMSSHWPRLVVFVIALLAALANNFVHARDGWTSVVPSGLALSLVTVALFVLAAILGARSAARRRIGDLA